MTGCIEVLGQDFCYAVRRLRKSPVFTLIAVLTLAIGIGATTAVFSVINGVLLRPLPYPDADRLISVSNVDQKNPKWSQLVSSTDVAHWRADNNVFEALEFISHPDFVAMSGAGWGERVGAQHVSARLLPLLGVKSFLGTIPPADVVEKPGFAGVLISYEFWKHHFGGDPKVLGQKMFVDTFSGQVVGVLEPGFDLFGWGTPEVYIVHGEGDAATSGVDDVRWFTAIGKLKRGVSIQQGQAAMDVTAGHLVQAFPEAYKGLGVRVESLQKHLFGWSAEIYFMLFGAVGLVLLIACANVANLSLVRGDARRREIGVRIALGANQGRLIRQILADSVLLSVVGGFVGLALSSLGVRAFNLSAPMWFPKATGVIADGRVLLFTFCTCVITGIAFGIIPAYRALKSNVNECLRESARSTATVSRHRTRNTLVVTEIALAFVLLICAGLMINTMIRILRTTPGFNPEHLLTAEVRLTGEKYMDSSTEDATGLSSILPPVDQFCRRALERTRNIPGVEEVALADWLPLLETSGYASPGFTISGRNVLTAEEKPTVLRQSISPNYFGLMGIPVLRGRGLAEQDTPSNAWVVVINKAMAEQFWKKEDPIGSSIILDDSPQEKPRLVVGVV